MTDNDLRLKVALAIWQLNRDAPTKHWPHCWFHEDPTKCRLSPLLAEAAIAAVRQYDAEQLGGIL